MSDAVGSTAHAFDASREEQGLCPHEKNPAFNAGMVFYGLFSIPQSHNLSRTATSECPRSDRVYSTFGGI